MQVLFWDSQWMFWIYIIFWMCWMCKVFFYKCIEVILLKISVEQYRRSHCYEVFKCCKLLLHVTKYKICLKWCRSLLSIVLEYINLDIPQIILQMYFSEFVNRNGWIRCRFLPFSHCANLTFRERKWYKERICSNIDY